MRCISVIFICLYSNNNVTINTGIIKTTILRSCLLLKEQTDQFQNDIILRRQSSNVRKLSEEFEDTKGLIRICISKKNRQHNDQKKSTKGQTTIYKTYI